MKAPDHFALWIVSTAIAAGVIWLIVGALTKPVLFGCAAGALIGTAINVWRDRRAAR